MTDQAIVVNQGWQLESLSLRRNDPWHKKTSAYSGKMIFRNSESDEINFNIPPENMEQLLSLISVCVIDSAKEMGNRLVKSILPPLPKLVENNTPE